MEKRTVHNKEAFISEGVVSLSKPREKINKIQFMKTPAEKQALKDAKKLYKQSLNNK